MTGVQTCALPIWPHRQGERHFHADGAARFDFRRRACGALRHAVHGLRVPGVHAALPAVAAISTVRAELGWRYAIGMFVMQCGVAWLVACAVRLLGLA